MNRLAGHALLNEGAPFLLTERTTWARVGLYGGVGGTGRARCSCGDASPILTSAHQRKKWHRQHKARVTDATD